MSTSTAPGPRLTTPFGFAATTGDVLDGVDLGGRRALVTGGTSGLGRETARALAAAGAEVVLGVRNADAGRRTAAEITAETGNLQVSVLTLDLADLTSVRAAAEAYGDRPLHMLIANAGIMALPELTRTPQGREMQFAVNFLGHYALTTALHGALARAGETADGGARVVVLSSNAHLFAPPVFDDLDFRFRPYHPLGAYGESKTADVLLAVEAARRWADDGITANAVNPGAIATNLQQHTGGLRTPQERRKTPAQGAATPVLLAASPLLAGVTGRYFEDGAEAEPRDAAPPLFGGGVAPFALDPGNAAHMWEAARASTG